MKFTMFFLLMIQTLSCFADNKIPYMPRISENGKLPLFLQKITDPVLLENVKSLEDVSVFSIIKNNEIKGVVVSYSTQSISVKSDYNCVYGNSNKTNEHIFIVGLSTDGLTNRGRIWQTTSGGYNLFVWRIGEIDLQLKDGDSVTLKKFTVDPQEAAEYYKKNKPTTNK